MSSASGVNAVLENQRNRMLAGRKAAHPVGSSPHNDRLFGRDNARRQARMKRNGKAVYYEPIFETTLV
jgi:hypothetical protein